MENQKIFKSGFINELIARLSRNEFTDAYFEQTFVVPESAILSNLRIIVPPEMDLLPPDSDGNHDFENAVKLFEAYKSLTPTEATDGRLWAYLSHASFWAYMKKRWPVENQPEDKRGQYILEHWFLNGLSAANLTRHGISMLWWGAFTTYDSDSERSEPFELTKELFSMLDYTRTLISGMQGRNRNFAHAILEFVIENKDLFGSYKESRIRFLMRRINYFGGYKILPSLSKAEIKKLLETYRSDIEKVSD